MPSASLFALPVAQWQQRQAASGILEVPSLRKRKKRAAATSSLPGDEGEPGKGKEKQEQSDAIPSFSQYNISSSDEEQYRVAGLAVTEALPPRPFPHGPRQIVESEAAGELPNNELLPSSHLISFRYHHFCVLTTILHRCILQEDFTRAGRAFGILLRTSLNMQPPDIRVNGTWGIGAEILLRQDPSKANLPTSESNDEEDAVTFTDDGFARAKAFYDRLIVQYPHRRIAPDALGPLDFYPAMFGLWIYLVRKRRKAAEASLSSGEIESRRRMLASELRSIREIDDKLESLMVSPPYSDSPRLLTLQGSVALWKADVLEEKGKGEEEEEEEEEEGQSMPERAREKARVAFDKARQRGGTLWSGIAQYGGQAEEDV